MLRALILQPCKALWFKLLLVTALVFFTAPAKAQSEPAPFPTDEAAIAAYLAGVPAEELATRLMLLAFPGPEVPLERLAELRPGGLLFYPSNVPSTENAREIVRTVQASSDWPLLYGIDQEGGPFNTYRVDNATIFPGNMALGATHQPDLATAAAVAMGEELAYLGVNLSFAPSVDVNSNPDNPIIGIRSFGSDVAAVSEFGQAYLAGLETAGVVGVAKHFPGHGDTGTDSHLELPLVARDRAQIDAVELAPFKAMIAARVPAIMTAHVAFPALGTDLPATLSKEVLTDLLRGELGFGGLIITDYMDMAAITSRYGAGEAAVLSVLAGTDLLLVSSDLEKQREVAAALTEAIVSGRLPEQRVREAVARSFALAVKHPPQLDNPEPNYAANAQLAKEIGMNAATLLWNDGTLPLSGEGTTVVIAPRPTAYGNPPHLGEVLATTMSGVNSLVVSANPTAEEQSAALAAAEAADVIVLGVFHWQGAFPAGMASLAEELAANGTPLVVVALGNPDDNRFLPRANAYLAAYGFREANLVGATAVLTGATVPRGMLPVPAGDYPVGWGLTSFEPSK